MQNPRIYGENPYGIAVIHGGPGAPGSMAPVARELSKICGTVEPLQTQNTLDEQVEELKRIKASEDFGGPFAEKLLSLVKGEEVARQWVMDRETSLMFQDCFDSLDAKSRKILIWVYFCGQSSREIADALGINYHDYVERQLIAIQRLRDELERRFH